jgi:hypothetical protein
MGLLDVDGIIILKRILKEQGVTLWTELNWFRVDSSD